MSASVQLTGDEQAAFLQDMAIRGKTTERIFECLMEALDARKSVRVPTDTPGVYVYDSQPDHVARIGAATLMLKVLRMMPEAAAASVNVNVDARAIEISASEVVADALSVGISEDDVLAQIEANVAEVRAARAKGLAKGA